MRRFSTSAASSVALLLACASALSAQDTAFVSEGSRVKVFPAMAGAKPVSGQVAKLSYDTLVIVPKGNGSAQTFYSGDLRKIEMVQGKKSNWLKGGIIGGGVGLASFAIAAGGGSGNDSFCSDTGCVARATALGAGIGFAIGAGIGALSKSDRWVEAEFPAQPPVALNVGKDGSVRLAFSLRL
jgi:hypothetical protein